MGIRNQSKGKAGSKNRMPATKFSHLQKKLRKRPVKGKGQQDVRRAAAGRLANRLREVVKCVCVDGS